MPHDGSELGADLPRRPRLGHRKRVTVAFLDEVENVRDTRSSVGGQSSHGHPISTVSSDEETSSACLPIHGPQVVAAPRQCAQCIQGAYRLRAKSEAAG